MFPIMHVVGIRRSLLEKHPWLAMNTHVAYQKAKAICYRQLETIGHMFTTLPWPVEEFQRARVDGRGFLVLRYRRQPTGIDSDQPLRGRKGIIDRRLSPEDLFGPSTLALSKI